MAELISIRAPGGKVMKMAAEQAQGYLDSGLGWSLVAAAVTPAPEVKHAAVAVEAAPSEPAAADIRPARAPRK